MHNKIIFKAESDVALSNFSLEKKKQNSDFVISNSATTTNSLTAEITTNKNTLTSPKELILRASATYTNKNGETSTIKTPYMTIVQQSHPQYFTEGSTTISTMHLGEEGGIVTVKTYAVQEDNPNKIVNSNYFKININGTCAYSISEPMESDDVLMWNISVTRNSTLSKKTLSIVVLFNDGNDSTWHSSTNVVKQDAHVQILGNPIFTAVPTTLEYTGGDVAITSYYTVDDVTTPLGEISVVETSGFTDSDYLIIGSGATRTLRITQNNSKETPNGDPNKSLKLKVGNPKDSTDLIIGPIKQKTKKQGTYVFNFTDGTFEKNIITAFSYEAQTLNVEILSTKTDDYDGTVELGVTCTYSNQAMISGNASFIHSVLTLGLAENTGEDSRNCVVTIKQNDSSMPSLTLYIAQAAKEPEGVLPAFDYMIITLGSDMLSGEDMDVMVYAKDMMPDYQYYKCVGFNAEKYLEEVEFKDTGFNFTDGGDETENSLRWSGDNTNIGSESILITPKKFLTEQFITEQLKAKKEYFDIDIYANFYRTLYTGLSTIKLQAYVSSNDALVVENPYSYGDAYLFKPDTSAEIVLDNIYHAWVKSNGSDKAEKFKTDYTKIGTLKYKYSDGSWRFEQDNSIKVVPSEEEKEQYHKEISNKGYWENLRHRGTSKLKTEYIFGSMHDSVEKRYYDFFTFGADNYAYINESEHQQHSFNRFAFYYDQTQYQIRKIAITNGSEPTNDDWHEDGGDVYDNDFEWLITQDPNADDVLWIYIEETGVTEETVASTMERETYHLANSSANVVQNGLVGSLIDPINGKTSTFKIISSTSTYKKIQWTDTTNGDTSASRYLLFSSLSGYDTSKYELQGLAAFSSTPTASSYTPLTSFKFYPNAAANNILFKWRDKTVENKKIVHLYGSGHDGTGYLTSISYGFSNTRGAEPTRWTGPNTITAPSDSKMQVISDINIVNNDRKTFFWIKLNITYASSSSSTYTTFKVNNIFDTTDEYLVMNLSNNSCMFSSSSPI